MAQTTGQAAIVSVQSVQNFIAYAGSCRELTIPSLRSKVARTGHDLGRFPEGEHTRNLKSEEN